MHAQKRRAAVACAIGAAALYALSAPFAKILLHRLSPAMTAALCYLGAGLGIGALELIRKAFKAPSHGAPLMRRDAGWIFLMIVLDVAAPILLMLGLARTTAENASLLGSFEIVATSLIALFAFREPISRRLWISLVLVTLSSAMLAFDGSDSLRFSIGSGYILLACACWGMENNVTRRLSGSNPLQLVVVKGFGSGAGSLLIALWLRELPDAMAPVIEALLLGFVAYGLSIFLYVVAQRTLGAARTSAYYAVAPFIGVFLSLVVFRDLPPPMFWVALSVMLAGTCLATERQL